MKKCILKNYKITCHTKGNHKPKDENLQQHLHLGVVFDICFKKFVSSATLQTDQYVSATLPPP